MNENLKEYGINEDVIRGMVIAAKILLDSHNRRLSPRDVALVTGKRHPGKQKMELFNTRQAELKDAARRIAETAVKLENGQLVPSYIQNIEKN